MYQNSRIFKSKQQTSKEVKIHFFFSFNVKMYDILRDGLPYEYRIPPRPGYAFLNIMLKHYFQIIMLGTNNDR